ncbi:MAG: M48 family metalloprotease [Rickettsiales bacterium]|nr:M48 family metalloprotease [Rickettsiales bacterium]
MPLSIATLLRLTLTLLLSLAMPSVSYAGGLIRDAEIEHYLRHLSSPVWTAAGLEPQAVSIFIIDDDSINAFVAGGSNIFFHTGLLLATDTPEMLIGVIAHETGHIAGGHLARGAEQVARAQIGAVISFVLGAAAAASGAGDAGAAILSAGPHVAERGLLAFTRANEQAADQAGLSYLETLHLTPEGMLNMFERLRRDEKRFLGTPDPYALTHPLTKERISSIRSHVAQSPYREATLPANDQIMHQRMQAKLYGYMRPLVQVQSRYIDASQPSRYARAVAYYRASDLPKALQEIDSLLTEQPNDAYFHELKGQMLFENGRIKESREQYQKASQLAPDSALLRSDYARTLLASPTTPTLRVEAIALLERASRQDPSYNASWRLLAEAYGKAGEEGKAHLALSEEAAMRDDATAMRIQANLALETLPSGSPAYLRAQDIKRFAIRREQEKKDEGGPFLTGQSSEFLSPFTRHHHSLSPSY